MSQDERRAGRFAEVFASHQGYLSDKWEHYLGIYEAEIGPYVRRGAPINLLEIGVQNGGSLQIWSKYLPKGSTIVGVDIDAACKDLSFPDNVIFVHCNAADAAIRNMLPNLQFDIIIDDGSHTQHDITSSFALLWDRVAAGGKYIVEDIETSYDVGFGGGLRASNGSIEWAKGFIDAINYFHISDQDLRISPDHEGLREISRILQRITFYDSTIVFHMLNSERGKPYQRVFAGDEMMIMNPVTWADSADAEDFGSIAMNSSAFSTIDTALIRRLQELIAREADLKNEIKELKGRIAELDGLPHERPTR